MTPVEFLNARLDEIEQRAKKASEASEIRLGIGERPVGETWTADEYGQLGSSGQLWSSDGWHSISFGIGIAQHIAYWDPHRVLALCEALRKLIELHKPHSMPAGAGTLYWCTECDPYGDSGYVPHPEEGCPSLHAITTLFPDYQDSWRP